MNREEWISERLVPVLEEIDARRVTIGGPLIPTRFIWRKTEYAVAEVLETWRETGPCRHGSGERYVRKHWFRIRTTSGEEMKLYFERQARSKREIKRRWWLYSVTRPE